MSKGSKPIVVAVGFGIRFAVLLLTFVGLSRIYSPQAYGDFRRVWLVIVLASVVSQAGMPAAIERFLPRIGQGALRRRLFGSLMGAMLLGGLLTAGGVALCSGPLAALVGAPELAESIAWGAWLIPSVAVMNQCMLLLTAAELHLFATCMSALLGGVFLSALWWNAWHMVGLNDTFFHLACCMAIPVLILALGTLWLVGQVEHPETRMPSLGQIISHAGHAWASGCLGEVTRSFPRTLASAYSSSREFAVFSNGAIENPLLNIICMAISSVMIPKMARAQGSDKAELEAIIRRTIALTCLLCIPLCLLFVYKSQSVMVALYGANYAGSAFIFTCYSMVTLFRILPTFNVLNCMGLARENTALGVLNLLLIGSSSYVAGRYAGFFGIGIAVASSAFLLQIAGMLFLVRGGKLKTTHILPLRWIGRIFAVSLPSVGLVALADHLLTGNSYIEQNVWIELFVLGHVFLFVLTGAGLLARLHHDKDWPLPELAGSIRAKLLGHKR